MAKRVTIMIADEIDKKVRLRQAKIIAKTNETTSYSSVIGDLLKSALK